MAGVLIFAAAGGLFLFLASPAPMTPPGCDGLECGPALAIGTATAGTNGTDHIYTMMINPSGGLQVDALEFELVTASGSILSVNGFQVQVLGTGGCLVATFGSTTWSDGPATAPNHCTPPGTSASLVTSGMQLVVSTGTTNLTGDGDKLVLFGDSSEFSGQVSVPLP